MGLEIKIPIEVLRQRKLFLATPCYGGMCTGMYARSQADLAALCTQYGIQLQIYSLFNESLITRARAYCADEFMRSPASHLLFIDSDIAFSAQDVIAMLALMSDDGPYDIMGAPYPKKTISWEKIRTAVDKGFAEKDPNVLDRFVGDYVFNPKPGTTGFQIDQPAEVLELGTGFMMIRRQTLERWRDANPNYWYKPDHVRTEAFDGSREIMLYFQAEIDRYDPANLYRQTLEKIQQHHRDPEAVREIIKQAFQTAEIESAKRSKRYLSEDYFFCQRAQEIGLRVWLCPWMKTIHTGTFNFGGSLADLAQLGVSATADADQLKQIRAASKEELPEITVPKKKQRNVNKSLLTT